MRAVLGENGARPGTALPLRLHYTRTMSTFYGPAVAFTHEQAFTEGQKTLGPELLNLLASRGITQGLIVDLGCGSGVWLEQAARAGFDVLGVDVSEALLAFAQQRLPKADLTLGSIYEADLPQCSAITALGEVLNYVPDATTVQPLLKLVERVHRALLPAGLFIFDVIDPYPNGLAPERNWHDGDGFAIMFEKSVKGPVLKRDIVCFLRTNGSYEREHETHYQRLFSEEEITGMLKGGGFEDVKTMTTVGAHQLLPHRRLYIATKA